MKTRLLTIILLLVGNIAFSQKNPEIKVKPVKENGKANIYYRLKNFSYIPNTKIIDWQNSLEKLEASEIYDEREQYFEESCTFSKGKKTGEFTINILFLKEVKVSDYTINRISTGREIVAGNYVDDKYNGPIKLTTFVDFVNKEGVIQIDYDNGMIKDQALTFPEAKMNIHDKEPISFQPKVTFLNGKVSEKLTLEAGYLNYTKYENNTEYILRYTEKPYCYHNFSFPIRVQYSVALLTDKFSIECFKSVYNPNQKKYLIEGEYRLFMPSDKFFDTTQLIARYNFSDGKRNGLAQITESSEQNPYTIKLNFKNDLLDGICEQYYPDGKLSISAKFTKGFPTGEAVSYYNAPKYPRFFEFNSVVASPLEYGGILMIHQIGKWDIYTGNTATIRKNGGKISDYNGYGVFCKINYDKLDSSVIDGVWIKGVFATNDYSLYNNGKQIVDKIMDKENPGQIENMLYKDETGKVIISLKQLVEDVADKKAKETEEKNNTLVHCVWCNKEFKYGNRTETDLCPCFKSSDGSSIGVMLHTKIFCSNECRSKYQKDCCIKNGYNYER
jgi:antitoxin component YwqK of YwqJK toxin-antitoxin module